MNFDRLLVKAKKQVNGAWVEGFYVDSMKGPVIMPSQDVNVHESHRQIVNVYEIYPSTLCQCTGLKDKNRQLIFEGDIVVVFNIDEGCIECETEIVHGLKHDYPAFELKDTFSDECNNISLIFGAAYTIEVVGNIHDKENKQNDN